MLRNLSLTPAFVKTLARTPGCIDMLLHCRQMCPKDVLVQRSARTIMILVQRVTQKEGGGGEKNTFTLTQPRPATSSAASSSLALSASTTDSSGSGSTPMDTPPRENEIDVEALCTT